MSQDFLASLGITAGTSNGNYGNWGNCGTNGYRHHQTHNYNSGWNDRSYESHHYEGYSGKRDKATQNWLVGGAVGQLFAGIVAQNDPDAGRAIGNFANMASTIGLIRDTGRERYQHEYHNYGYETNSWNSSQDYWYGGSTDNTWNQYNYNPWICY